MSSSKGSMNHAKTRASEFQNNGQQILQNITNSKPPIPKPTPPSDIFMQKTSQLSQIFAEQDELTKMLMAKLNKPDSPKESKNLTKQQINNIMKSGPNVEVPLVAPPKEKDYDAEL